MSFSKSEFAEGHWEWSEEKKGVLFISHKVVEVDHTQQQQQTIVTAEAAGCTHADLNLEFRDVIDILEQIRFRRCIQRQIKHNASEAITLQDVKDVVLFHVITKLSPEFIDMIHTHEADRFFRALIFYFQYFLQVCDELYKRRLVGEFKARQLNTITVENVLLNNLADLRSMVAREYCFILLGKGKFHRFHHMANKLNASTPERDIRLFELLLRFSIRFVWIALQRRSLSLIENEMYRMFRTQEFSIWTRKTQSSLASEISPIEQRVLYGENSVEVYKLLSRSPAALGMLNSYHDFRLLGAGFIHYEQKDERIQFLEAAYTAAENDLQKLDIPFGVLGRPREDYDAMLFPLQVPEVGRDQENELCYKSLAISSLTYMTTEPKAYRRVKLPESTDCMEDTVPSEFPKKSEFQNATSHAEQERSRRLWQTIHLKKK